MNMRFPTGFTLRSVLLVVLPTVAAGGAGYWFWYQHQPHYKAIQQYIPRMKVVEIRGEVVDAWCYASQTMGPGKGMGHIACATACIGGGVTAGILEDKTNILYIAAKYKGYQGCRELLLPLIGKKVVAYGWVGDLGGNRMLKISSVKEIGSASAQTDTPTQSWEQQHASGDASKAGKAAKDSDMENCPEHSASSEKATEPAAK